MTPTMGTVRSADGTVIAYEHVGRGPALVMVDAASGFRGFGPMRGLAALLADRFTVFCYDRRGRGESGDTPPYTVDREVDDLRALVAEAGGSAYLFGFSSGAVLALLAAARGVPVAGLALLEPPLDFAAPPAAPGEGLAGEIAALVAAGRRGDAVAHFQRQIGVPAELVEGMRQGSLWPTLEGLAHTLVYDLTVTGCLSRAEASAVTVPALVVHSESSDERLRGWARDVAEALPAGRLRGMAGDWHQVPEDALAPVLTEFLLGVRRGDAADPVA
ncbi:alpha/beta hydrolase [Micromonospora sp. B11E3]|uniref:alpha/beta fold hydrolase n=1 Tax=Micromonospora sp. B11E3 TaxID=3153562 RepID=UPI00325D3DC6